MKDKVGQSVEYQKVLKECTSNENWNISNSKLQILSDHSYNWDDYNVIMKHLWHKLNSKPSQWRVIFKTLNAMDYLVKNGAPRAVQDIKDDLFKIRALQEFSYSENGVDRGQGVRDKSRALCELVADPSKLQQEREFAQQTRAKFAGVSSTSSSGAMGSGTTSSYNNNSNYPAAPASGRYGGFGSEDINKAGYKAGQFNNMYDPYNKSLSLPTQPDTSSTKAQRKASEKSSTKKKNKKKKKDVSSSSEDEDDDDSDESSDDDESSSDEDEKKKKKKRAAARKAKRAAAKKEKEAGLGQAPKSARQLEGGTSTTANTKVEATASSGTQPSQVPDLFDLLSDTQTQQPTNNTTSSAGGSGFAFMQGSVGQQQQQQPQTQAPNNNNNLGGLFGNLNLNTQQNAFPQQQQQQPGNLLSEVFSNTGGPSLQQQPQFSNNAFGFVNQQNSQQQQQQQQPGLMNNNNNNMNLFNQQPSSQQQQQQVQPGNNASGFNFMSSQQQQQPSQGSSSLFSNMNLASSGQQQQPQTSNPLDLFSAGNGGASTPSNSGANIFGNLQTQQQPQFSQSNSNLIQGLNNLGGPSNSSTNQNQFQQNSHQFQGHQGNTSQQQQQFGTNTSQQYQTQPQNQPQGNPSGLGFSQGSLSQAQQQQQQQQPGWQPKSARQNDVWAQGSGLFDLNNLKSGEKNILETANIHKATGGASGEKNLLTDDLDQIWNSPYNTNQGSQGIGNSGHHQNMAGVQPKPFVQANMGLGVGMGVGGQPAFGQNTFQGQPGFGSQPYQYQPNQQMMGGSISNQFPQPSFMAPTNNQHPQQQQFHGQQNPLQNFNQQNPSGGLQFNPQMTGGAQHSHQMPPSQGQFGNIGNTQFAGLNMNNGGNNQTGFNNWGGAK